MSVSGVACPRINAPDRVRLRCRAPVRIVALPPPDQHQAEQSAAETAPGAEFRGVRCRAQQMIP